MKYLLGTIGRFEQKNTDDKYTPKNKQPVKKRRDYVSLSCEIREQKIDR